MVSLPLHLGCVWWGTFHSSVWSGNNFKGDGVFSSSKLEDHFLGTEQVQWLWKVDTTVHITLWMHRLNMYFLLVDMDGCSKAAIICFLVSFVRFVLLTLQ